MTNNLSKQLIEFHNFFLNFYLFIHFNCLNCRFLYPNVFSPSYLNIIYLTLETIKLLLEIKKRISWNKIYWPPSKYKVLEVKWRKTSLF